MWLPAGLLGGPEALHTVASRRGMSFSSEAPQARPPKFGWVRMHLGGRAVFVLGITKVLRPGEGVLGGEAGF